MKSLGGFSKTELHEKITVQEVKSFQLINIAMAAWIILFAAITIFLSKSTTIENAAVDGLPNFPILNFALIIIALLTYSTVYILPQILFTPSRLEKRFSNPFYNAQRNEIIETAAKLIQLYRTQMIVRLALLEFVSMFALTLLFVSTMNGAAGNRPLVWLLLTPAFIQLMYTYKTFPTKENIAEFIDANIVRKLR